MKKVFYLKFELEIPEAEATEAGIAEIETSMKEAIQADMTNDILKVTDITSGFKQFQFYFELEHRWVDCTDNNPLLAIEKGYKCRCI